MADKMLLGVDEREATDGGVYLSQIDIASAIMKCVDNQIAEQREAVYPMAERHLGAVFEAASRVVDEFRTGFKKSLPGSGITAWLASDDTGFSSRELADCLVRHAYDGEKAMPAIPVGDPENRPHVPYDPGDFGRCVRLLEACPDLRKHLPKAAELSPVWAALVASWDELEALYRVEFPAGDAPRLYERMRSLIKESEVNNG